MILSYSCPRITSNYHNYATTTPISLFVVLSGTIDCAIYVPLMVRDFVSVEAETIEKRLLFVVVVVLAVLALVSKWVSFVSAGGKLHLLTSFHGIFNNVLTPM